MCSSVQVLSRLFRSILNCSYLVQSDTGCNTIFFNRETREEMVLADMYLKPGEPWEYCPREALRRVSKILKEEFDLVCLMVWHTYKAL